MAIEKKPEQVTSMRRPSLRCTPSMMAARASSPREDDAHHHDNEVAITVDVLGARSGRKSSGGKPGRKPKSTSGSGGGTSNMGGTGSPGFTGTPLTAAS